MKPTKARDRKRHVCRRRGTTTVESAVVLAIALLLLLGMLEMSTAILHYNLMSEAARRVARAAIVHGSFATASHGTWGPAPITTNASSNSPPALVVRDLLVTLDPDDVSIALAWPDGDNHPDQRAQVTVSYTHRPIVSIPGWYSQLELQGISTMRIAH